MKRMRHPLFRTWESMRRRCEKPTCDSYRNYGGRGIKVCERWHLFMNFAADMGVRPEGMTLDRIDNGGDYSPDNCRWATIDEQHNNMRTNNILIVDGLKMPLARASEKWGIHETTIFRRIMRGWSDTDAAKIPARLISRWTTKRAKRAAT